jgi:DNA (cytosine-5)-methyltransferase 1
VLAKHWPKVARYIDVREQGRRTLENVGIICAGFPCQDVSPAGLRAGLEGERSGLWYECHRIVGELAPEAVLVENVAGGASQWLPFVRRDLEALGYGTRAYALSASDLGAPHLRRRIFVVAADPNRLDSRDEQQRMPWGRTHALSNEGTAVAVDDREPIAVADPNGEGQLRVSARRVGRRRRAGDSCIDPRWREAIGEWWATEPEVGRVAHGVSGRLDRLAGLGNAVVPQKAEVMGHLLAEILS